MPHLLSKMKRLASNERKAPAESKNQHPNFYNMPLPDNMQLNQLGGNNIINPQHNDNIISSTSSTILQGGQPGNNIHPLLLNQYQNSTAQGQLSQAWQLNSNQALAQMALMNPSIGYSLNIMQYQQPIIAPAAMPNSMRLNSLETPITPQTQHQQHPQNKSDQSAMAHLIREALQKQHHQSSVGFSPPLSCLHQPQQGSFIPPNYQVMNYLVPAPTGSLLQPPAQPLLSTQTSAQLDENSTKSITSLDPYSEETNQN